MVPHGEPAPEPGRVHGHHGPGDRHRHALPAGARRIATRARRTGAASRPHGTPIWARDSSRTSTTRTCSRNSPSRIATGMPPVVTPAGARLPGVPPQQAVRRARMDAGRLRRLQRRRRGAVRRAHLRQRREHRLRTGVHDRQPARRLRAAGGQLQFSEYVRVNNIADVKYVGSVIVGDTNGRYFEPAPGRNWFVGVSINVAF